MEIWAKSMTNGVRFPGPSLSCIDDTVPVCDKKYCVGVREAACIAGQKAGNSWARKTKGRHEENVQREQNEHSPSSSSTLQLEEGGFEKTLIWSLLASSSVFPVEDDGFQKLESLLASSSTLLLEADGFQKFESLLASSSVWPSRVFLQLEVVTYLSIYT